ncbi:hypothetical protein TorRG33x02_188720 [Trema orientale]|uniref:Uncharacterized protein n=1 Tax=Trema orientale TaxID=63057 RepID=A0A2P5EII9_TREOI|nr:hypothetical protein TorRG33x02_188720 [Trema orientale]
MRLEETPLEQKSVEFIVGLLCQSHRHYDVNNKICSLTIMDIILNRENLKCRTLLFTTKLFKSST